MKKQRYKCILPGFKKIPGFDGYYINIKGDIYSEFQGNILKTFKRSKNSKYVCVVLQQGKKAKIYLLHRLIALTFISNPNNYPEVDHIDGNSANNKIENLRWVTRKQNQNNPISSEKRKKAITDIQGVKVAVLLDGKEIAEFDSISEAARVLNLYATSICKVLHGKLSQTGGYKFKKKK